MGRRPIEPRITGIATIRLTWVAVRPYCCLKIGARPASSPHTAKATANDVVDRKSARRAPGCVFILVNSLVGSEPLTCLLFSLLMYQTHSLRLLAACFLPM